MKWFREWRAWIASVRAERERELQRACCEIISAKSRFPGRENYAVKEIIEHVRWVDKRDEL